MTETEARLRVLADLIEAVGEEVIDRGASARRHPKLVVAYHAARAAPASSSPSTPGGEPSDAAAEAFLDAHYTEAPFSSSGIRQYPHDERVGYIKKWLRAAYAVDGVRSPSPGEAGQP